jgi:glycerol-3-phosphate dehydrogenase
MVLAVSLSASENSVAIVGGGVVGVAVAYTLARRGVAATLLEAEPELALGASGTNSGILHTGFDSVPGALETELIVRSARLRDAVIDELGIPVLRCGAVLRPGTAEQADNARANGVEVELAGGALRVPGETVTDPVAYTLALAAAAQAAGTTIRTGVRVEAIAREGDRLRVGDDVFDLVVNCAGLHADDVARLVGDDSFGIYPRKGEFFVFEAYLDHILLPVPTKRTKGVLVFPTIDGKVIAGPTAHDQEDKGDWSVRPEARDAVLGKAALMYPPLLGAEPIASYAGLRPAGRDGANYVIGRSAACPQLINVAAIRSTGLSASLGIGAYVAEVVEQAGVELGPDRSLPPGLPPHSDVPWYRRRAQWA